jgi:AbrB family looped-hinge helix DNA binding protein
LSLIFENKGSLLQYNHIPVSSQGQITLPKPIRERLGIINGSANRINFLVKSDGTIIVEPVPTAASLAGILQPKKSVAPINAYEFREELSNERLRELGYSAPDN